MVATIAATTSNLRGPSARWRRAANGRPRDDHDRLVEEAEALRLIELGPPPAPVAPPARLRVVAWNAERLKDVERSAALLSTQDADIILLSEIDLGMVRSGNRRNCADLAALLGMTWAFGVEYVELGLGDEDERRMHAGMENAEGLHGNAILARLPITGPMMIRLEIDGAWFTGERRAQPRVGGRIAISGRIDTAGGPIGVVATHLESQSNPDHRAVQMHALLEALDQVDPARPWLIGGDFNTNTVAAKERGWQQRAVAETPDRLVDPVPYEPLFETARNAGYAFGSANVLRVATQRLKPGEDERPLAKLDWFFARGLVCSEPVTLRAIDPEGGPLSDHEPIAVTVERR